MNNAKKSKPARSPAKRSSSRGTGARKTNGFTKLQEGWSRGVETLLDSGQSLAQSALLQGERAASVVTSVPSQLGSLATYARRNPFKVGGAALGLGALFYAVRLMWPVKIAVTSPFKAKVSYIARDDVPKSQLDGAILELGLPQNL